LIKLHVGVAKVPLCEHYKEVPTDVLLLLPVLESCSYFTDCELHQLAPPMEVTNFRLTRNPMKYRMPLTPTTCPSRQHITEPILFKLL
jgi:hypothetical protein